MSFLMIYVTHENEKAASEVADYLVKNKYAACANLFPIKSAYWWKDTIQSENEWVSLLKTTPEKWENIQSAIESVHPYDVPCIIKIEVEANAAYEHWIRNSVATD